MVKFLLKLSASVLILLILFKHIKPENVIETIRHTNIFFILIAIFFQLMSTTAASKRWHTLMSAIGFKEPLTFYIKSYFKATFFNQVLPGSVSGDILKIIDLKRQGYRTGVSLTGVLLDRITGLFALTLVNLIALLSGHILPPKIHRTIEIISFLGTVGFFIIPTFKKLSFLKTTKALSIIPELSLNAENLIKHKSFIGIIIISVIVHICTFLDLFFLSKAVGLSIDFFAFFVIIPPVVLLTIIPISLAGWGVRESAMVLLFGLTGISKSAILSVSIMYGFALIISSLPGLYVFLSEKNII